MKVRKLAIILLAAGSSSRLGQPKQLLPFQQTNLLVYQCQQALQVGEQLYQALSIQVHCVLGFQADVMSKHIAHLPVNVVINHDWQQGLSSSIAHGIASLPADIDAALLLLIDQWRVTTSDLQQFIEQWQQSPQSMLTATKASATKKQLTGPPIIFPKCYFQQLSTLKAGQGAKHLVNEHIKQVKTVELDHAFIDLDTTKQLSQMRTFLQQKL
jgi:molybdenum cofactor cytidylyltransferase